MEFEVQLQQLWRQVRRERRQSGVADARALAEIELQPQEPRRQLSTKRGQSPIVEVVEAPVALEAELAILHRCSGELNNITHTPKK